MRYHNWKTVRDCEIYTNNEWAIPSQDRATVTTSDCHIEIQELLTKVFEKNKFYSFVIPKLLNYVPSLKDSCKVVKRDSTG
jgi:hypothetical protein